MGKFTEPSLYTRWIYMWERLGRWYNLECWVEEVTTNFHN